jgi:hypothetical protein
MAFRGFTEAKHKDGALSDLEARVKSTFNQVKNSRILGGNLLSGVKLKSTASTSNHPVSGTGMTTFTVVDWNIIPVGLDIRLGTQLTSITRENIISSPTAYDWTAATSNNATAESIVDAFKEGLGDTLAGLGVTYVSPAKVECIASNGSLREALVSYSPTGTASGVQAGSIIPTVSIIATTDFPDASTSDFSINELIRFGPRAPSSPGDLAPGVFRVKDIGVSASSVEYLSMSSLPSSMDVLFPYSTYDSGMYVYKLTRNPIPGVSGNSKYMILNQDRPSNIWSGTGGGNLSLFCDNDCTVDLWVF